MCVLGIKLIGILKYIFLVPSPSHCSSLIFRQYARLYCKLAGRLCCHYSNICAKLQGQHASNHATEECKYSFEKLQLLRWNLERFGG